MAGRPMRLLCVGRLKTAFWKEAADHYLNRIERMRPLTTRELRDAAAPLAPTAKMEEESARLMAALESNDYPIALSEEGRQLSSPQFAALLEKIDQQALGRPCFIIGGPYGLSKTILGACKTVLGLSTLTWPHELARVLLLEQIYRAECIRRKIPYHH